MKFKFTALLACIHVASCQTPPQHKSVSNAQEYSVKGKSRSYLLYREGESRRDLFETFFGYRDNRKYCQKALKMAQRKSPKYSYHCVPLPYPDEIEEHDKE